MIEKSAKTVVAMAIPAFSPLFKVSLPWVSRIHISAAFLEPSSDSSIMLQQVQLSSAWNCSSSIEILLLSNATLRMSPANWDAFLSLVATIRPWYMCTSGSWLIHSNCMSATLDDGTSQEHIELNVFLNPLEKLSATLWLSKINYSALC